VARRAAWLDNVWNEGKPVLMLDAGDMFGKRSRVEREQTRFLCEVTSEFGVDAIGVGETDLNYGVDFLHEMMETYHLPFTTANVRDSTTGKLVAPEYLIVERGGIRFGICAVADPDQPIITMAAREERFAVDDPVTVLRRLVPRLRELGAQTIVVIAHLGDRKAEQLVKEVKGIDICLVGHTRRAYRTERVVDQTALIAGSYEGRFIGRMDAMFSPDDGKLMSFEIKVADLGKGMPEDPAMNQRVEEFKKHLEQVRIEARGPYKPHLGSRSEQFITERECRKCHYEIWEKLRDTPHAQAFSTLARKGQAESPECLVCHTTGYVYYGGYDDRPPGNRLKNVQCEACHGYGTQHRRDGKWARQARKSCKTCHDKKNSPNFDYETYWAKIAH